MSWPSEQFMMPNMMGMQPMMWPNMVPNTMQPNPLPEFNMNVHPHNQNGSNFIGVVQPQPESTATAGAVEDIDEQANTNANNDKSDHRDRRDRDRNRADKGRHGRSRERDRNDRSERNDRSRSDRRERRTKWSSDNVVLSNTPGFGTGNMVMPGNVMQYGNLMPHQTMDMTNMSNMSHMANMMQPMQMSGMMDQNMMMMNQQMPMMPNQPIYLTNSVLLPPIPGIMVPQRMNRPVGCRTIFIGGLPNQISESLVNEMFTRFGDIDSIKMQKQGVCHVRFVKPESVEHSFLLSGYRFKYQDQMETEAIPIFVDYALNRDDQDEQERHRRRREPTPPRIEPFLATTLSSVTEKIKSDTEFAEAAPTLAGWLERGECNKKNANTFYSLIQATNNHIRRLVNEKMQIDEDFHTMKNSFKDKFMHVLTQFEQVAKILGAAKHQRVSDHFTKQQRRNVEMWLKMTEEVDNMKEEYNVLFEEDESDNKTGKNMVSLEKYEELKKDNENLVYELEGYKNEAHLAKDEAERKFETFKAHFIAEQALKKEQPHEYTRKMPLLPFPPPSKTPSTSIETMAEFSKSEVPHSEAKLISLVTAFLMIHPLGATLDYLVSYLKSMMPDVAQSSVSNVLMKYNELFQCKTTGVGANIELKWYFITFNTIKK